MGVHAVRVRSEPGVRDRGDQRGPARLGGGSHEGQVRGRQGRRGREHRHGRRGGREAVDDTFMLGGLEYAAQEDMFSPEGEEEGSVALVDSAGRLGHVVRGGEARGERLPRPNGKQGGRRVASGRPPRPRRGPSGRSARRGGS
jgi:hypothetical protein